MQYRRYYHPGAAYFFTVVTARRRPLFDHPSVVGLLRQRVRQVKIQYPFVLDSMVVLPDHLHCIWVLPENDSDFSIRWRLIKSGLSRTLRETFGLKGPFWQPRFWEHFLRDERDWQRHRDYIHFNPVKHGLVRRVRDWPHSSFHRFVERGEYPEDWGGVVPDFRGVGKE
ncbi:transposase [Marinimicrobium sp. LS-A18]|uniref:REP-associated tyrosine transposase n=1 Tax=Marinimicrobium sp. LS-A18 TaxID=1381596 RepID=UPI0009DBADFC|nr:transposase [Marinimicrobium sp. LS-A18]